MSLRFAATLVFASLMLTGCSPTMSPKHSHYDATLQGYTSDELMFAQMMIPHHNQAVAMSELAPTHTENKDILALAARIKAAQAPEVNRMTAWLASAGESATAHDGMLMEGMLTNQQMTELASANGRSFDKLYLEGMIQHHKGAITMLKMIETSQNIEVMGLAGAIRETQTQEISEMTSLLKNY